MKSIFNKVYVSGWMVALLAAAGCAADTADGTLGQVEDSLTCDAPINALADWIASTRAGTTWCIGCSFVTAEIRTMTGQIVLNYWAGIDEVQQTYVPRLCVHGFCTGGYWRRLGIRGESYGPISVGLDGTVSFADSNSVDIQIAPQGCGADVNGTTTITGRGSDGIDYTVTLSEIWFS